MLSFDKRAQNRIISPMFHQLFLIVLIVPFVHTSTLPSPELHVKYGGLALTALKQLLDFFESDVKNLNLDGLYGLRIAQGQLYALEKLFTSTSSNETSSITDQNNHIQSLVIQIERIANQSLIEIARQSYSYLHRFALIATQPFLMEYQPRKINDEFLDHSERSASFNEDQSDACFAELLGSIDRPNATKCFVTHDCWSLMTKPSSTDYRLTHQLLWFLVAKNIGCIDNRTISEVANKHLQYLEDRYCTNIYHDAQTNFDINDNEDLFLEQILLCSIIGYEEFLRFDWFQTILTWQSSQYGCFGPDGPMKSKRHLLVEQDMSNGCLAHKSGLASGVLATYARALLQ